VACRAELPAVVNLPDCAGSLDEFKSAASHLDATPPAKILATKAAGRKHYFFFVIFIFGNFRLTAATTEAYSGFPELLAKASRA
jgi:hypothetical protein